MKYEYPFDDIRGRWEYFLPVHCHRYGIKVSKRYDNKNDDWLRMNGNDN